MIILGYDIETTGLDRNKDRIIEVGLALYSTGQKKFLESTGFLVQSDGIQVSDEITGITGITQTAVDRFGYSQNDALESIVSFMQAADAVATHNGLRFDMPVTMNMVKRLGASLPEKPLIDTMYDIPGIDGEKLIYMCAVAGFVNPNQHSAEDDAKSVIKLMEFYGMDDIIERSKLPLVVIQSHQHRLNNDDAKKFKFRWNPERKIWWKAIKETDINQLAQKVPFQISVLDKSVAEELILE